MWKALIFILLCVNINAAEKEAETGNKSRFNIKNCVTIGADKIESVEASVQGSMIKVIFNRGCTR